jgi:hypothetical protein
MRDYNRLQLKLRKSDQEALVQILRSGVQQVRVVLRALALLRLSDGESPPKVARFLDLTPKTVRDIGKRYLEAGLDRALYERPRPGAKPLLNPNERQRVIAMVCSDPPGGAGTLDGTADRGGGDQAKTGSAGRSRNHTGAARKPRPQAVAGKKCGAWPSWMKSISGNWKTYWNSMKSLIAQPSRWSA